MQLTGAQCPADVDVLRAGPARLAGFLDLRIGRQPEEGPSQIKHRAAVRWTCRIRLLCRGKELIQKVGLVPAAQLPITLGELDLVPQAVFGFSFIVANPARPAKHVIGHHPAQRRCMLG